MTLAPSSLLSAEESRLMARPLRGWSEDDRSVLADAVQAMLSQWNAAWALAASEGEAVEIRSCPIGDDAWGGVSWSLLDSPEPDAAGSQSNVLWGLRGTAGPGLVALRRHRPVLEALHAALFLEAPGAVAGPDRLADRLVRAAWADWNKQLAALLPAVGDAPNEIDAAALIHRRWSGALLAVVPWCGRQMGLLLTADLVSAFLSRHRGRAAAPRPAGNAAPLAPLFQVTKGEGVSLRVELGEMQVDLGTLAGLRPGDVLRTSHRLDAPFLLTGQGPAGRVTRCTGYLGRHEEWRAIELLPYAAPAGNGKTI